jgi:hypothetical protein
MKAEGATEINPVLPRMVFDCFVAQNSPKLHSKMKLC